MKKEFQEEMKSLIDEEGLIQPKVPTPEDEAQERHERLMHRLRGIDGTHPARTTDQVFLSELTKAQAACAASLGRRQFQGSSS